MRLAALSFLRSRKSIKAVSVATLLTGINLFHPAYPAKAESQAPSVEELQREIEKRDITILDLMRRVEALEQKLAGSNTADQPEKKGPERTEPAETTLADEEVARALERTLVREGGLVLPKGSVEVEPRFTYTYRGLDALRITSVNGQQVVVQQDFQRHRYETGANFRLGLPWNSQLDLRLPYVFDRETTVTARAFQRTRRDSGLGDLEVGITHQLLFERGWVPDLLATVNWNSKTGGSRLGTGFHVIQGAATAVKRRDPLAFFGTVSYSWSLSDTRAGNRLDAGDTIGFRMGTVLAASPDTSLRLVFELNRAGEIELNRRRIPGSDSTVALFEFGLATIVLPRVLLDIRAGIGLTTDSPDFRIGLSLPMRVH